MWAESKVSNDMGMDYFRIVSGICIYRFVNKDKKERLN